MPRVGLIVLRFKVQVFDWLPDFQASKIHYLDQSPFPRMWANIKKNVKKQGLLLLHE
jgi:hypothetical protein